MLFYEAYARRGEMKHQTLLIFMIGSVYNP